MRLRPLFIGLAISGRLTSELASAAIDGAITGRELNQIISRTVQTLLDELDIADEDFIKVE